jgi:hypothetical protein
VLKCSICNVPIRGKYARFCPEHRSQARRKRIKWQPTPAIDEMIRESWRSLGHGKAASLYIQERTGWPDWAVKRRAVVLGVAKIRRKELPWSSAELAVLDEFAWMCPQRIGDKLRSLCGTQRTPVAIVLKRKRRKLLSNLDGYSPCSLAELLGVDSHRVARWIKTGLLKAESTGIGAPSGERLFIHHKNAYRFVVAHPEEIDLCRVEKLWFLDLVTQGKIGRE